MKVRPVIVDLIYEPEEDIEDYHQLLVKQAGSSGHFFYLAQESVLHVIRLMSKSDFVEKDGINYHFIKGKLSKASLPFKLNKFVKSLNPDVIIVHGFFTPLQHLLLTFQTKIPVIVQYHGGGVPLGITGLFQRLASKRINHYIFTAKRQSDEFVRKGLISATSFIHEIPEGSSTIEVISKQEARKALDLEVQQIVFIWVGRLDINKDPLTVLEGLKLFLQQNEHSLLLLVYQQSDLLMEVNQLLENFGNAKERVRLVGEIPHTELANYYCSADYFVSGSHYEGSGYALFEALACGCVPLVTDIPSFRVMTDNGNIGGLWRPGNYMSLRQALTKVLAKNYNEETGKARSYYNSELSFDAIARKQLKVVSNIRQSKSQVDEVSGYGQTK